MNTKYESQSDNINAICPYCGNSYQVESEDYRFDGGIEICDECGKSFHLETFAEVTHRTSPNCELNGAEHDWVEKKSARTDRVYLYCNVCGKIEV